MGGIPQSAKLAPPNEVGPSKDTLFLESDLGKEAVSEESELGEEVASEESEAPPAGLAELEGAIRVQTAALQNQLTTQE